MKQYNDWEEIDKDTNGLVTSLTYMVLFVNDQVYNYTVSLMEAIRNSEHYRHNAKRTANAIEREINAYNTNVFRIAKANKEALAEITQSMEEDVQPHIDRYYYTISQILLDHGVSGMTNRIASLSSTINMLAQMSRITISDFGDRMRGDRSFSLQSPILSGIGQGGISERPVIKRGNRKGRENKLK